MTDEDLLAIQSDLQAGKEQVRHDGREKCEDKQQNNCGCIGTGILHGPDGDRLSSRKRKARLIRG